MSVDDDLNLRECRPVRFLASEILTCFPDTTEAQFSALTCSFSGKAHVKEANFAFVALQGLTWGREEGDRGMEEEELGLPSIGLLQAIISRLKRRLINTSAFEPTFMSV